MTTTASRPPIHHPWRSAASAWWTSSALATVAFAMSGLSSHSFIQSWSTLGPGDEVMALQPLVSGLMTLVVTAAVLLSWRRPGVAIALLPLLVPAALTYAWSLGWWLAVVLVAVLTTIRGTWLAVAPWLGAAAITLYFCRSGEAFATPIGPIFLRPDLSSYLWLWFGMLGAAFVVAAATRLVLLAARRSEAADAATATAEAVTVDASRRAAVVTERAVVARDLHDVVAHHVSLVAVRAESAPYVLPDLDEKARELLAEIATDARTALAELRSALAVLDRGADGAPGSAPRAPLPTAEDVPALLAQVRGAGQVVEVEDDALQGQLAHVDAAAGYVVYRTLQEALTNVRRHAPGAAALVDLSASDDGVTLVVTNDAPAAGSTVAPGRGLLGMTERAESLGGNLTAGAEDGRFAVRLVLPGVGSRSTAGAR